MNHTIATAARRHATALVEAVYRDACRPTRAGLDSIFHAARVVLHDGDIALRDLDLGAAVGRDLLRATLAYAHGRSAWHEVYSLRAALDDPMGTLALCPIVTRSAPGRGRWAVAGVPAMMHRSGGTTAEPFSFPIWRKAFPAIEVGHHYRAILKEFALDPMASLSIVRAVPAMHKAGPVHPPRDRCRWSHGADHATAHTFRYRLGEASDVWCAALAAFARARACNVLVVNGSTIGLLADWLRRGGSPGPVCQLVSNSFEAVRAEDAATLVTAGFAGAVCDHMRCWDGGATFLTCRHGRVHLLEHLGHAEAVDGRLVMTDYFALAAPFVRYWAGDGTALGDVPVYCACGRWSRPFTFAGRWPFTVTLAPGHVLTSIELYDVLMTRVGMPFQAACGPGRVRLTTHRSLGEDVQLAIKHALAGGTVEFRVGEYAKFGRFGKAPRIYEERP